MRVWAQLLARDRVFWQMIRVNFVLVSFSSPLIFIISLAIGLRASPFLMWVCETVLIKWGQDTRCCLLRGSLHPNVWVPMESPKGLAMEGSSVIYIYIYIYLVLVVAEPSKVRCLDPHGES